MSGLFGGKKASSQKSKAVSALQVQTSTFGQVLPLAYGKNRMAGNLGWYGNWIATAHTDQQSSGGKGGGGGGSTSTSYTYTTGVIILLCEGPITGIGTVWKDKELHTLSDLGFTLFTGTTPQTAWSWLQSYNSSQAIPYSGMAYVGASALQLGSSTGLPNLNYEVKGLKPYQAGTVDDALPSDILTDYLTDSVHGAGFGAYLGSTTQLANYCLARGLFMSPIEDQQRTAADFVNDMATWCNFAPVWSYNMLNLLPYGDTAISSSYGSYTPNVTPIYALGADDFKYEQGNQSGVELDWKELEQCHNSVRVEYNDRSNSYNTVTQEAKDQADIDARGPYPMSSVQINGITSAQVARDVAQLMLQRDLYIRKTYHFRTDMRYMLLEPMDIVTLTDPNAGLTNELVRITKVTEQNDEMDFEAEELPIGVASAPQYAPQNPGGYSQDFNVSPGSVSAPVIFNAPGLLTKDGFEMWVAVAGIGQFWGGCDVYVSEDNTTYQRVGRITAPARYGALTAALPIGNDPDTTNAAQVSLLRGQLNSGTQADADNWRQMAFVGGTAGGEVIAFETATLTGTLSYSLSYLRRGGYGSSSQAHVSGDVFARIDEAIFRLPYDKGKRGNTVYFKFTSFNVFGGAMEQLSAVTAYSHVVGASDVLASTKLYDQLAGQYASPSSGANFIPNPSFELNNIRATGTVSLLQNPVCDSWYVYANDANFFGVYRDTVVPFVGTNDLSIIPQNATTYVPASTTYTCRVVSSPIYVQAGQVLSYSGDIRTDSSGGNDGRLTWKQVVGMLFFNSSGVLVSGGDSNAGFDAAANTQSGAYTQYSTNQFTVPAGASYAVAYVFLSVTNPGSTPALAASWAARFDNLIGTFVTAANQVNYASGQTAESLKPAMANADNTATVTGVYVINPGFENGGAGWTTTDSSNAWGFENNANGPNPGTTNHCAHGGTTQATCILSNNGYFPVAPGQIVKATCKVKAVSSPNGGAGVRIEFYDNTGAPISAITGSIISSGMGISVAYGAAPSSAVSAQVGIFAQSQTTGYYTYDDVTMVMQPSSIDEVPDGTTRFGSIYVPAVQSGMYAPGSNLIFNPNFALGLMDWSFNGTPAWQPTTVNGETCAYVSPSSTASTSILTSTMVTGISAGYAISVSLELYINSSLTAGDFSADVQFYNSSGGSTGSSGRVVVQSAATPGFVKYILENIGAPASSTQFNVRLYVENATSSSAAVIVRRVKAELGSHCTPFNDAATQHGNKLSQSGSGQRIGDQRNLPAVTFSNYGSGWQGMSLSYTATSTSATISATAATLQAGSTAISYNASSVTVSGSPGTNYTYYLYYSDPTHTGGSIALGVSATFVGALNNDGYVYIATLTVSFPSSGTSGGSGGAPCPLRKAWVIKRGRGGKRHFVRAGQVHVGDFLLLCNGAWGEVTYSKGVLTDCVRLISNRGTLGCSATAPIKTRQGVVNAPECAGKDAMVLTEGATHTRVQQALPIGEEWVQHITCQNDFFWTGDSKDCLFAHHNMKPP